MDATSFGPHHRSSELRYRLLHRRGGTARNTLLFYAGRLSPEKLEAERDAKAPAAAVRGALTESNYAFEDDGPADDGLRRIAIVPRRKDTLLLRGSILVTGSEADLVAVEGMLVKRPSFWTRRVAVVRRYQRVFSTRVPVSMTSTADVLVAGTSTFSMTYEYQSVNGMPVAGVRSGRR